MYTEDIAVAPTDVNAAVGSTAHIAEFRQRVWANGYRPIPVRTNGKAPSGLAWPDAARRDPPRCAEPGALVFPSALNTGILTDTLRPLDIDVDDAEIVAQIEAVALDLLGRAPTRFRADSSRILMMYRAAEGEPSKRSLSGSAGKVEAMGRGNQVVCSGTHPDGATLQWRGGSPVDTPLRQLSDVSELMLDNFFATIAPLIGATQSSPEAPLVRAPAPQSISPRGTADHGPDPGAFFRALNDAALANLGQWVPSIFSGARRQAGGGFRVSSRQLGRKLQEDLSLTPSGIVDFGVHDMGDPREGRRTPIDIVMEHAGITELVPAAHWLCDQIGRSPADFGWEDDSGYEIEIEIDLDDDDEVVDPETGEITARNKVPDAPKAAPVKTPIIPVPADAPAMAFKHPKFGVPESAFPYHDAAGALIGYVARWAATTGQAHGHVAHVTYCDLGTGKCKWRAKNMPHPRPLFGLPAVLARSSATVLICEDEPSANAAATLFPDMVATTIAHDPRSPRQTDFSPLSGRDVVFAAGQSPAARTYASLVAEECRRAGAASVRFLNTDFISGFKFLAGEPVARGEPEPGGWSLASALAYGWTPEAVAEAIAKAPRATRCEPNDGGDAIPGLTSTDIDAPRSPFKTDKYGVYRLAEKTVGGETKLEYRLFCSPLAVVAMTRDEEGKNWGRLLRIVDPDDNAKEWAMPMELLAGDGTAYRGELLSLGLTMEPGTFARDALHSYISTERPRQTAQCVSRTGWHGKTYVGANQVFGAPSGSRERIILQTTHAADHAFRNAGALVDWQENVARLAVGNSRLIFAISAALAGPLLYPTGSESGGFHFRGASSSGKSTALAVAGSVWGGGGIAGFMRTWRGTANGIEGIAAQHCDALLCLDEMSQVAAHEAGQIAYMLSNGVGKTRAGKTGNARSSVAWRTLFLSTGEISLSDKIAEEGKGRRAAAGQEIRIVDIPIDAGVGLGAFEALHGFGSADAFARHLKTASGKHYGHASRAFLTHLAEDFDGIAPLVRGFVDDFLRTNVSAGADGQVSRVAARFGLVAAAGEMATAFGTVPWGRGEALRAATRCFADWLATRGGVEPAEAREAIAQVRRFIEMHGSSRFEPMGEDAFTDIRIVNRAGFREEINDSGDMQFVVLPQVWKSEVCQGLDASFVARTLADRGLLLRGSDGKPQVMKRLPGFQGAVRVYVLSPKLMSDAEPERMRALN